MRRKTTAKSPEDCLLILAAKQELPATPAACEKSDYAMVCIHSKESKTLGHSSNTRCGVKIDDDYDDNAAVCAAP
ncbi:hypothetical protein T265_14396, partial [Opisthorchis viverrini]